MKKNTHVLLVNSDVDSRNQLHGLLSSQEYRLSEAKNGLEAVDLLQDESFDLVITDAAITDFDSWRLTRMIRAGICHNDRTLPIIMITHNWCENLTERTAREHQINTTIAFEEREQLPDLVRKCLTSTLEEKINKRVLVVEDDEDTAFLVTQILQDNFDVEVTADGESGLEAWMTRRHDLVLLDIMLPGITGHAVLEQIKNIDAKQPVVMMTAYGTIDIAKSLLLNGASDFVAKPFRAEELRWVCDLVGKRADYMATIEQFNEKLSDERQAQPLL